MDKLAELLISFIFNNFLFVCMALMIVLVIIKLVFSDPKVKGIQGEKRVNAVLRSLPNQQYIVLSDVLLQTSTGTTQIDHIVVSIYGTFWGCSNYPKCRYTHK